MSYLERAMTALSKVGVQFAQDPSPVVALLDRMAKYDTTKVTSIAATLQQSSAFNAALRDQLDGMNVAARYAEISEGFDSIRDDAALMATWMEDGQLNLREKFQMAWMRMKRGSIPSRFEDIRSTYLEVARSAKAQIERETVILEAYRDFRMALKAAEVDAQELLKTAGDAVESRKVELEAATKALEDQGQSDPAARSQLELRRDEALRALQDEDQGYQLVKNVADDLKTGYNTAELVFARLQQTQTVKQRLYERAVSFFATNEVVFTGLSAAFTSMGGLNEATQTLESMKTGMNKGLEALAGTGSAQLEASMRSAYGSTLQVDSVKKLADSVVQFQASSAALIKELRETSTRTAAEIEHVSVDAKQRFAALLTGA